MQNPSLDNWPETQPIGRFRIERRDDAVVISWRWLSWKNSILPLIGLVIVGGLVGGALGFSDFPARLRRGPLPEWAAWAITACVGYGGAAIAVNKTTIRVGSEHVRVHHGPLWWPGSRTIPTAAIAGVRVQPVERPRRHGRTETMYEIIADSSEWRIHKFAELDDEQDAEFLADQIGRALERSR